MNCKKLLCTTLIATCLSVSLPAQADMLPTDSAITQTSERAAVEAFFARADVVKELEAQGVSAADALARVATMSDAEVSDLNGRIDQLPAGGDILGIIFTVFIILLITDILGFTKVFPFTRSIR